MLSQQYSTCGCQTTLHTHVATCTALPRDAAAETSAPRRLLLCLDGVPFELIRRAKERGLFDFFNAPARLLSPFPTMTNVALSQMFGASAPYGYESLYFNRDERALSGGWKKYVGWRTPDKVPSSYMDALDYQEPLMFEFLVYVAPDTVWQADMQKFRDKFLAAKGKRDFFAFLKATDGLLHIKGAERLQIALRSLDKILREIRKICGSETEIVLFSDHGMNLEENRRVHLQTHLKKRGYAVVEQLNTGAQRGVVAPAFGLCSYAALYCRTEHTARLTEDMTDCTGVDFAVRRDGDNIVYLQGARGTARIVRRKNSAGEFFKYHAITGDVLQLDKHLRGLRDAGKTDAEGFAADADWYAATAAHLYPDAIRNIFNSLHAPLVKHTADILLSLQDGYFYGSSIFSRMVTLAATHGNALRSSTDAFLMSTTRDLPAHLRAADAGAILQES